MARSWYSPVGEYPPEEGAKAVLESSPRHGERAEVKVAGHEGQRSGQDGAKLKASEQAWPAMLSSAKQLKWRAA